MICLNRYRSQFRYLASKESESLIFFIQPHQPISSKKAKLDWAPPSVLNTGRAPIPGKLSARATGTVQTRYRGPGATEERAGFLVSRSLTLSSADVHTVSGSRHLMIISSGPKKRASELIYLTLDTEADLIKNVRFLYLRLLPRRSCTHKLSAVTHNSRSIVDPRLRGYAATKK